MENLLSVLSKSDRTSRYLRSEKLRRRHEKVLIKAAEILELWKPISCYIFPLLSYPESEDLTIIAETLSAAGSAQSYRPEEIELKTCARELSELFLRITSLPLPKYVGQLMFAAFKWRGTAGDIKAAAKKLLKDRRPNEKGELKPGAGQYIELFRKNQPTFAALVFEHHPLRVEVPSTIEQNKRTIPNNSGKAKNGIERKSVLSRRRTTTPQVSLAACPAANRERPCLRVWPLR
jgi:hypothetical protein